MRNKRLAILVFLFLSFNQLSAFGPSSFMHIVHALKAVPTLAKNTAISCLHNYYFMSIMNGCIFAGINALSNYANLQGTSAYELAIRAQGQLNLSPSYAPDEAKRELVEPIRTLITPLKDPIPGYTPDPGLLLVGPLDRARTTIRAMAAYLNTPFVFESGMGIVGAHTGSGAASVTRLYKRAQQNYDLRSFWTRLKHPSLWFRQQAMTPTLVVLHDISQLCSARPEQTEYQGARKNLQTIIDGAFVTEQPRKVFWIATIEEADLQNANRSIVEPLIRSNRLKCIRLNGEQVAL